MNENYLNRLIKRFSEEEELKDDNIFYYTPHKIKNNILLFGRKKSSFPFHLLVGPEWNVYLSMCLEISVFVIIFILFVTEQLSRALTFTTICLVSLTLFFYTFTACTDPGIVYRKENIPNLDIESSLPITPAIEPNTIECTICNLQRPERASHCYKCGVCVERLDHHCSFTGKCIGRKNIIPFFLFVGSVMILMIFVGVVTLYYIFGVVIVNAVEN